MSDVKAYPKPWEIVLSKILMPVLGVSQLGTVIYFIVLLFSPIIWTQLLLLACLNVAIGRAFKNAKAILDEVKNDNNAGE